MRKKFSLGGFADGLERTVGAFNTGRKLGEAASKLRDKPAVKETVKTSDKSDLDSKPKEAYRRGGRVALKRK